jgi:hypothetical protein
MTSWPLRASRESSRTLMADFRFVMPVTTASGNRAAAGCEGEGVASGEEEAGIEGEEMADAFPPGEVTGDGDTPPHPATSVAARSTRIELRSTGRPITPLS